MYNNDQSALRCLLALCEVEDYLNSCGISSSTDWRNHGDGDKGFKTDMGYLYEGLEGLKNYLIERLRKRINAETGTA